MKIKSLLLTLGIISSLISIAQVRDNWVQAFSSPENSTIYNKTTKGSIVAQGKIYFYGDTISQSFSQSSFISFYEPSSFTNTYLSYVPRYNDNSINHGIEVKTTTPGLSYLFFGTNVSNETSPKGYPAIYRYNTLTTFFEHDSLTYGFNDNHTGIRNIAYFNDSLRVFAEYDGQIKAFTKATTSSGFRADSLNGLLTNIEGTIVHNNKLYVYGDSLTYDRVLISNDGVNYSRIPSFNNVTTWSSAISEMDTLNNELYLVATYGAPSLPDSVSIFNLTSSGIINPVSTGLLNLAIFDLKGYKNKLWYGYGEDYLGYYRPNVNYITPPNTTQFSIDSIGVKFNKPENFFLNVLDDVLYYGGDYSEGTGNVGTNIYKLLNPRATLLSSTPNTCLNTTLTFTASCLDTDSIQFFVNGNYLSSYSGTYYLFSYPFSSMGPNDITIVAHGGTLTDTASTSLFVNSVDQIVSNNTITCKGGSNTISTNVLGGSPPYTYNWLPNSNLSTQTASATIASPSITTVYSVTITDANNCSNTATVSVNVIPSKNISGTISPTLGVSSGSITLYQYDTQLSLWNEVQTIPYTSSYSFTSVDSAQYVLRATPSESSLQITYNPSSTSWQSATIINHGCAANTNQTISIAAFANIGTGTGSMSGEITEGIGFGQKPSGQSATMAPFVPGEPIGGIIVKGGKNPGGNYFSQTETSGTGTYTLTNIPNTIAGESIFIFIDIPGLDTAGTYYREFTSGESFTGLNFVVDSAKIRAVGVTDVGINKLNNNELSIQIFPNPAKNYITITGNFATESILNIEVIDILGQSVKILEENHKNSSSNFEKKI